jgi:MFS family permease
MGLGIVSTGYGLGFAVMGLLFPILVDSFSWRFCWYLLGASVLVMVPVNGVLLRSRPEDLQTTPWGEGGVLSDRQPMEHSTKEGRYGEVLRLARFWTIGASLLFASFPLYMVTTFMVDYADVELGFGFKAASFLATIHGLCQVVGVLTIPMLSDRIGRRLALMGSNIFVALGVLAVIVSGQSLIGLYVSMAFFGIFYGAIWPLYGACGGDYFRKGTVGTVVGAWTLLYGVGAISAHFVAGRIRDVTHSFEPAFYLAIISALVASFLITRVKTPATQN